MINLNSKKFRTLPLITKDALFEHIEDIHIYRAYTNGELTNLNTNIISPLRPKEKHPSFGFFESKTGEILFKDFTLQVVGDSIKFVQLLFSLTYFEALSKIALDFKLDEFFAIKNMRHLTSMENINSVSLYEPFILSKKKKSIKVRVKPWTLQDVHFWRKFGISKETLVEYRVFPIEYLFSSTSKVDHSVIKADRFAYVFMENKDDKETYKIYQPFNKLYKWINTHNDSVWQGWEQLPKEGKTLIITKSLKDVMAIVENTNYSSVSLQTESTIPKQQVMDELRSRFSYVYLLYDNDFDKEENWGRKFGDNIEKNHSLFRLEIPDKHLSKDFSDLIYNKGKEEAVKILKQLVKEVLPF